MPAPGNEHAAHTSPWRAALALWLAAVWPALAVGSADVAGRSVEFTSPAGEIERCVALDHFPGGGYAEEDIRAEAALCAIDFHAGRSALCPKVFSTSPGTLIYDVSTGPYAGRAGAFEENECATGGLLKKSSSGTHPVSFKMSVNTRETSATFANASLVYYHFSRYFDTSVHVPVAVLRSIDRKEHERRVATRGALLSAGRSALKMNHAAWQALLSAVRNPSSYAPAAELFTRDELLYGVLLRPTGTRYGEELNGTRASGWGDGQNRDFQETAPFRALRSAAPLPEALAEGRRAAAANARLARATGTALTDAQLVFWMSDLVDITLLDYLFSQQDRIGNIDYVTYWYWLRDGKVERRLASDRQPPDDLAAYRPWSLKRTELGDNDAGIRVSYVNYTKRTHMLENLRHYKASTYQRLTALARDFDAGGPLYTYARGTFGLSDREFAQVADNVASAARILQASCASEHLRFDIDPEGYLLAGRADEVRVDCDR